MCNQVACEIWCKTAIQTLKLPLKLSQWQYTVEEINHLLSNKIKKTSDSKHVRKTCTRIDTQSSAKTPMLQVATGSSQSTSIRLHRPWDD